MPVSIQIGGTGGDRKAGTASAGPVVVININASARAEPAPAGEAATAPGLIMNAGPAPLLTDSRTAPAVSHAADSYPPAGAVSAGGAPPAGVEPV